ncbi:MAG: site-2 protease family protein [Nanoarchaeota archaeon]
MGFLTSFVFYDLTLLAIFVILSVYLLHKNRANLEKQGIIYLYKAKWGIKLIHYFGKKYKRILGVLSYVSVIVGYALMMCMIFLFAQAVYIYVKFPEVTKIVKAPPIVPVIPYFTNIFGLESYFPPFYFTYFIIAVSFVAIVHEFSHGIFASYNKLKIKSTGLAFLGPILGAFVEPDEKAMQKKPVFGQLSILSAGVLANLFFAFIFYVILLLFFINFFTPAGVYFTGYASGIVNSSDITSINGIPIQGVNNEMVLNIIEAKNIKDEQIGNFNLTEIAIGNQSVLIPLDNLKLIFSSNQRAVVLLDSPAIKSGFPLVNLINKATITELNNVKIESHQQLSNEIIKYSPGENISIKIKYNKEEKIYNLTLEKHPNNPKIGYIGITSQTTGSGFTGRLLSKINFYKNPEIDYKPTRNANLVILVHDFLWWIALINLLVALFNMLPLGILDGGRFFYLTIFSITKSEKAAKIVSSAITYIILGLLGLIMLIWFFQVFVV